MLSMMMPAWYELSFMSYLMIFFCALFVLYFIVRLLIETGSIVFILLAFIIGIVGYWLCAVFLVESIFLVIGRSIWHALTSLF